MGVVSARHHRQPAGCGPPFAHGHAGDFAHREAMEHRYRQHADARAVFRLQDRTVDLLAVGVGAVEHHDRAAERGAGVHHAEHRDVVGVEADTHVLHIDQQHVERAHRLVRRPELPSVVEREDRNARGGIHAAAHRFARIGRTAEPVLGGEDAPHVEARIVQHIDQMHAPGPVGRRAAAGHFGHGRMVGQHRHAPSAQQRIVGCRVGHADQHFLRPHGPRKAHEHAQDDESFHRQHVSAPVRVMPRRRTP